MMLQKTFTDWLYQVFMDEKGKGMTPQGKLAVHMVSDPVWPKLADNLEILLEHLDCVRADCQMRKCLTQAWTTYVQIMSLKQYCFFIIR